MDKKIYIQKTRFELVCVNNEPTRLPLPHFCFAYNGSKAIFQLAFFIFFSLKVTAGFGENAFHQHLRNTHYK